MPETDRQAAADVIIRYASAIDDRDFESYRGLFCPDVAIDGFGPAPIRGVEDWIAFVEKALLPYRQTQHMLGPPQVEIDGDSASMRTDLQALHFLREPKGEIFSLWGAYRTQLVRANTGWLIEKHRLDVWGTRTQ